MSSLPARRLSAVAVALVLVLLNPGCQSTPDPSAPPAPARPTGQGITEYRDAANLARAAVEDTLHSLQALSQPHARGHDAHPALERFDASHLRLELASIKARARAEAILARGRDYFEEWHQHLHGLTNAAAARTGEQRYGRMHAHFVRVEETSAGVKTVFRPYLDQLRELRARFDRRPDLAPAATHPQELQDTIESAHRVLHALDAVQTALHDAHRELRAILSETATR